MGLERTAAVMQGKVSVFETDLFLPIVSSVAQSAGKSYGDGSEADRFVRIVAEHSRAIAFLIGDGVVPSNEGRGYVLRRVLRRACLFGGKLGLKPPYLSEIAQVAIDKMGATYPELIRNQDFILKVIRSEEERFAQTLDSGLNWLERELAEITVSQKREISGETAFRLYDTYGFPKELTAEIAQERGFSIDLTGFEQEMTLQRERARAAQKFGGGTKKTNYGQLGISTAHFVGYDKLSHSSVIVSLMVNGNPVEVASSGEEVELILWETPFYGEMGGQVGDSGEIVGETGKMVVAKAIRPLPELIVHQGRIVSGQLYLNEEVRAEVNQERRLDIARNHTATHLLQSALRQILGEQVHQAGSLVAPERLRFDFSYPITPSEEQLLEVAHLVNDKIRQNLPITARIVPYSQAIAKGAIALFGEKYGEAVRMIEIGEPPFSRELCGGTHVNFTGEIGSFYVVAESGIGAGARRIEAITGRGAESVLEKRLAILTNVADKLESPVEELESKLTNWFEELERTQKRVSHLEQEVARITADSLLPMVESVNGVNLLSVRVPALSLTAMREIGDQLKRKLNSGVIVLGGIESDKVNFVVMVTPDLISRGFHAGKIARQIAQAAGGGGGGQAGLGQGSSKQKDRLEMALKRAREIMLSL
jgi:alanyl-tRNA synthetase